MDRIRRRGLIWTISIFSENDFDPAAENPLLILVAIVLEELAAALNHLFSFPTSPNQLMYVAIFLSDGALRRDCVQHRNFLNFDADHPCHRNVQSN